MRRTFTAIASAGLLLFAPAITAFAEDPLPLPYDGQFMVEPQHATIMWTGWAGVQHYPSGRPIVVTVDHDADGTPEFTTTVTTDAEGRWQVSPVDLQPGYVVHTDTGLNGDGVEDTPDRMHVVYGLAIDGWDMSTDEVWGHSDPLADGSNPGLQVCVGTSQHSFCMNQWFPTGDPEPWNVDGTWRYQFPDTYLVPGASISAAELDDDADQTAVYDVVPGSLITINAWPTQGLWDQVPVGVNVSGFAPNSQAWLTINVAADPTNQFMWLPPIPIGGDGRGGTTVNLPRFVAGVDCAPDNCILVTADPNDPFVRNATLPLSFGRLDLFRFELANPEQPWDGGTVGAPIGASDVLAHGEFIWVEGSGFAPNTQYMLNQCKYVGASALCRNTWSAMPWAFADGVGSFGVMLQVGAVMYGPWGSQPQWTIAPEWDLRDGATVMVSGTGLPTGYSTGTFPRTWIGARRSGGDDPVVHFQSAFLDLDPTPVMVDVTIGQALEQQLEAIVHVEQVPETVRSVGWDWATGSVSYAYTGIHRWVSPEGMQYGPFDPEPTEEGYYDCADQLPYDTAISGAQESVHCSMYFDVTETVEGSDATSSAFTWWTPLHFARFDLTAKTEAATLVAKPAGVTLRGEVTCTGFSPEQYLVDVHGTLTQTTTGRKATTITAPFQVNVTCSGTMTNPGTTHWTVFVPGAFKAGEAIVELQVTSPGFTRTADPFDALDTVTIMSPPKGGGKR